MATTTKDDTPKVLIEFRRELKNATPALREFLIHLATGLYKRPEPERGATILALIGELGDAIKAQSQPAPKSKPKDPSGQSLEGALSAALADALNRGSATAGK